MLKTLDGIDLGQTQRTLSSLTRALLPSPGKEDMQQRIKALPSLQQKVLREVRDQLGLAGDMPTQEEVPAVLDSLAQELSVAALRDADIDDLQTRAFEDESKVQRPRERNRPRVFISSSVEGSEYARAIQERLADYAVSQLWDERRFDLGRSVLESLVRNVSKYDFAVLVFSPDDYVDIRKTRGFARANVAFEAGLFVGRLGTRRTFFVAPSGSSMPDFGSDIAGVTTVNYHPGVHPSEAAGPAAYEILHQIRTLGPVGSKELGEWK